MRYFILIICLVLLTSLSGHEKPSPFLEDILQEFPNVRDLTLIENEAFFTAQSPLGEVSVIMVSRKIRNKWRKPEITSFSGSHSDLEPFLSSNGRQLYFASNRPLSSDSSKVKDYDLWMVQRDDSKSKWSHPINLGAPVNTEHHEFYPSLTQEGTLYFTSDGPDSKGKDDIFYSTRTGNNFGPPISLSDSINTPGYEFNAFIAPDESYLLFSGYNREDGLGSGDLYISFRKADKTWTEAVWEVAIYTFLSGKLIKLGQRLKTWGQILIRSIWITVPLLIPSHKCCILQAAGVMSNSRQVASQAQRPC